VTTSTTLRTTGRRTRGRPGLRSGVMAVLAVLVAACGGGATVTPGIPTPAPPATTGAPATPSPTPAAPVELTIGLGYVPDVQFAQFYLADQAGYYRDAGLAVTFENKLDPELITLVGQGAIDIGIADGTSVIPAVSQDPIPVRRDDLRNSNIVLAKRRRMPRRRTWKGKIGTPGRYGSG
jgi:NitT/TauT family transport system substrate-binding protein